MLMIHSIYSFIKEWLGYLAQFLSLSFKTKNKKSSETREYWS